MMAEVENLKPREYTEEETREKFLRHIWMILEHCLKNDEQMPNTQHKMEVFMHSFLAALDGCSLDIPPFIVAPIGSDENTEYFVKHGENFYPVQDQDKIKCDIGGGLHELMYKYKPKSLPERD